MSPMRKGNALRGAWRRRVVMASTDDGVDARGGDAVNDMQDSAGADAGDILVWVFKLSNASTSRV